MANCGAAVRVAVTLLVVLIGLAAMYGLLKPVPNGCVMTYMYPTYIPIPTAADASAGRYGLFLYHEGWKKIDFEEHLKKLSGVPVLFIPGNGGSYKQVRSLAAESARAFQGGPPEANFYSEASFIDGVDKTVKLSGDFAIPSHYSRTLDWFAVDLEGEHSAMDGRILEEHTDYVVFAIHRILDHYKEIYEIQSKEGGNISGSIPTSVVLVGHSMGGFVARAAIVHPNLRISSVETVVTLSSPHQSPPVALQPSLGHFFSQVNSKWRKGYEMQIDKSDHYLSAPSLSNVVVISISGGINDYQVRTKFSSLDGIVPASNGFMVSSTSTKNVWLSMDHQSILWCNQLVIQVAHTLLVMANLEAASSMPSAPERLSVFARMLQSGIPPNLDWRSGMVHPQHSLLSYASSVPSCPASIQWPDDVLEKDLYIQSPMVTVLAMDGRRRWLDIRKLGSEGRAHFVFVTNLAPCSGVRLHLWPEKNTTYLEEAASKKVLEVTSKIIHIPAGPAPRQVEPGSQTEQPAPSAFLWLTPEDMHNYRFLTISVAPRPTISGRPPPAASMAVGQFFIPKDGRLEFSPLSQILSGRFEEVAHVHEDHALALNLSFSISLGIFPTTLSVQTAGCGIKSSTLPREQSGDTDDSSLCKLRCFPPVALAWDETSALDILPNMFSETVTLDSLFSFWELRALSPKTTVLLLVDPHCSYKISAAVSWSGSASRFVLSYPSEIVGFLITVIFFALMRQARAWELDVAIPSILTAVELNLITPMAFLFLFLLPLFVSFGLLFLKATSQPPASNLFMVSIICYSIANGIAIILIMFSKLVLYAAATVRIFFKLRWQACEDNIFVALLQKICSLLTSLHSFRIVHILSGNPGLVMSFITIPLVCFVHPAVGLFILLLYQAWSCHTALCSFLGASFRSHSKLELYHSDKTGNFSNSQSKDVSAQLLPRDDSQLSSPSSGKHFGDTQEEIFNFQLGVLMLHLIAALMFLPSLIAWLQRIGMSQSFPSFIDSILCIGIILHVVSGWKPDMGLFGLALPRICGRERGLSLVYLLSGYYSYFSALAFAPYRAFHAMAAVGGILFLARLMARRTRVNNRRKHSHKH